jgi:uncharacterized protein (DUF4415 family)
MPRKEAELRVDADVLEWFKSWPWLLTCMNAVLRVL